MARLTRRTFLKTVAFALGTGMISPKSGATKSASVSLEEMIRQMVIGGFRGFTVTHDTPIGRDIRKRFLGGVVLYDYDVPTHTPRRNIQSPAQVKTLDASLKHLAPFPLTIAVDEEGGRIARLKPRFGFPPTVSSQVLGAKDDPAYTYWEALGIARTLKAMGITLNFAPVVDLNVNPDNPVIGRLQRSFSADPTVVTRMALAFIRAHHELGIRCTLKHFPGHGSSSTDSHLGFVDVTRTWSPVELEPFRNVIKAGKADAVMTAHIFNAKLDPRYPVTLSKTAITGILREKLGYDGVVISDDMQMGAIRKYFGFEQAILLAVNAGVDILIIANNTIYDRTAVSQALTAIQRFVREGKIPVRRIEKSYRRIRRLKRPI